MAFNMLDWKIDVHFNNEFFKYVEIESFSGTIIKFKLHVTPEICNEEGLLDEGFLFSLIDVYAGHATIILCPSESSKGIPATMNCKVSSIENMKIDYSYLMEIELISLIKKECLLQIKIKNESGCIMKYATILYRFIRRAQF
jgi:hypothetical protein